jgi:hypothetical protein
MTPVLGPPLLIFLLRRRGTIEEIFLVSYGGIVIAHLFRTVTPDQDRDVLVSTLTAIWDFIRDAFARSPEGGSCVALTSASSASSYSVAVVRQGGILHEDSDDGLIFVVDGRGTPDPGGQLSPLLRLAA